MINFSLDNKNLRVEFLSKELDHHIANEVREEIDYVIQDKQIKNIVFDFKNMNFMDSSGIGVVIGRYKKISSEGGKVAVINLNSRVKKVFDLSGMNKIIEVHNTYEDAISSFLGGVANE
ncbi:anti-sigma F factor antagonist [Paraclostridium ghonii]|uniref:anti-sigma F factor antagonist n=1 Tax=Paraclostridium ghonii TaxID=29358 RepID=UPI00202CB72D|nr:anti-sigma F factor antagonist [Paeniclostridium ghonii]MCM0166079.1 anti-sigma F factor antagonist [Paeniclostridium ghonii]